MTDETPAVHWFVAVFSGGPTTQAQVRPGIAILVALRIEHLRTRIFRGIELQDHPLGIRSRMRRTIYVLRRPSNAATDEAPSVVRLPLLLEPRWKRCSASLRVGLSWRSLLRPWLWSSTSFPFRGGSVQRRILIDARRRCSEPRSSIGRLSSLPPTVPSGEIPNRGLWLPALPGRGRPGTSSFSPRAPGCSALPPGSGVRRCC